MPNIDMKHKNIGATVALLKSISEITKDVTLPEQLIKLFNTESDECDYKMKHTGNCSYGDEESQENKCIVDRCPLGKLINPELLELSSSITF